MRKIDLLCSVNMLKRSNDFFILNRYYVIYIVAVVVSISLCCTPDFLVWLPGKKVWISATSENLL